MNGETKTDIEIGEQLNFAEKRGDGDDGIVVVVVVVLSGRRCFVTFVSSRPACLPACLPLTGQSITAVSR